MRCPHCGKELKDVKYDSSYWLLPSLLLPAFILGLILDIFPINIEDGYSFNWGIIITFVFTIFNFVYLELYNFNKVKGRFVLMKKEE